MSHIPNCNSNGIISLARKESFEFPIKSFLNKITIKINGIGNQYILGSSFSTCPNITYLNGNLKSTEATNCKIIDIPSDNSINNTVELIWDITLTKLDYMFIDLSNLIEIDLSEFDCSLVTSMFHTFSGCSSVTSINLANLKTSSVRDMYSLFNGCQSLTSLDVSSFNTSLVNNMKSMFYGCENLLSLDLSNFKTSNVLNMDEMFRDCKKLNSLYLSKFDTSKVKNMKNCFTKCQSLKTLDLSSFDTSEVADMAFMFSYCENLVYVNLSSFDTSEVTDMTSMFSNCKNLVYVNLSSFDTTKVEKMETMFDSCKQLTELDITKFNTKNVKSMSRMFSYCNELTSLDLSNFDTTSVTSFSQMFNNCYKLTSLNLSSFDTTSVTSFFQMFNNCYKLTSLNLSNFETNKVTTMGSMFESCQTLSILDISNFNTSKVNNTQKMFYNCEALSSLDVSNFDTSNVENMNSMFCNTKKVKFLNLSNFNTTNVTDMSNMFSYCESLKFLDLSNFNTAQVTNMDSMFKSCKNLESLSISNFDISLVINMKQMFYDCYSLTSLNLLSFGNSQVTTMESMFHNCKGLSEINLSNFNSSKLNNILNMFRDCTNLEYINFKYYNELNPITVTNALLNVGSNLVICIDVNNTNNFKALIDIIRCPTIYCCNDWRDYIKHYNSSLTICEGKIFQNPGGVDYCQPKTENIISTENLVENNIISTSNIISTEIIIENKIISTSNIISTENIIENKIISTSNIITTENIVENNIISTSNIISTENIVENNMISTSNIISTVNLEEYYPYFNYSKNSESYYLDDENSEYNLCFSSCKTCDKSGNETEHNCKECKYGYDLVIYFEEYKNCYVKCPNYYKYEFRKKCYNECPSNTTKRDDFTEEKEILLILNDKYFCKPICDLENPFELLYSQECVHNCSIKSLIDKSCLLNDGSIYKEKEKKENALYDILLEDIEKDFTSYYYNTSNLDKGNNEIVKYELMKITLTTTEDQRNNIDSINITAVDIGKCELILREKYKIPDNELIYMKIVEVKEKGMRIPKIEYDVYSRLNGTNLIKLNLSYCKNVKLDISIPILLNESVDKHNSSSGYYNDICYPDTSEYITDIILKDRQKEFIEKNKTVCQENCIFSKYNNKTKKATCTCEIEESSSSSFINIHIDKKKLYKNFIDIKNIVNINLLYCYKVLFSKEGLLHNYGNIFLIVIILIHFILLILFYTKDYKNIKKKIQEIEFAINYFNLIEEEKVEEKNTVKIVKASWRKKKKKKKKLTKNNNPQVVKDELIQMKINFDKTNIINKKEESAVTTRKIYAQNVNEFNGELKRDELSEKVNNIMLYNDEELNKLTYELAIKCDHRTYFQYYISLLRTKHLIIMTFFNNNDYNSKIIKIDLLLFNFSVYCATNTLFFSDDTMHKIYEDKGAFNFIYQLPQIIYSCLISVTLNMLLKLLALSQAAILGFKKDKTKKGLKERKLALEKKLKIKFIIYFILCSILLIFFWYYISMFCAIYVNTQIHLFQDTIISFCLSLLYPFGIYLIPGLLRIPSLYNPKNDEAYLYNFSKIVQMI